MKFFYFVVAIYLTYYTFKYGRQVWKEGNKAAGVVLYIMSMSFPVLSILLLFIPV